MPKIRKATRATTLISAAQNSISPKSFTLIMFMVNTMIRAMSAMTHCGTALKAPQ
ncbi:Uncharacterised protein [Mycobacteroides abscessus]|nr:Uncharacterised protein [Mycobacteroides abscessus]